MIKKLINYYKRKNQIISSFVANTGYLVPGKYKFDRTFTYIYLDDNDMDEKITEMFDNGFSVLTYKNSIKRYIFELIFRVLSYRKLIVRDNPRMGMQFEGIVLLPAFNKKDIKIFSLGNGKVMLRFLERKEYDEKILNYEHFKEFFPMPQILNKDDENFVIIERFINFKPVTRWNLNDYERIMVDMLRKTINYLSDIEKQGNYTLIPLQNVIKKLPRNDKIVNHIKNNISVKLINLNFPFIKLHGDLWISNILIDKKNNRIKYIDFERSKQLILFYDIFFMMWYQFIMVQSGDRSQIAKRKFL